jgi:hypothetical protein
MKLAKATKFPWKSGGRAGNSIEEDPSVAGAELNRSLRIRGARVVDTRRILAANKVREPVKRLIVLWFTEHMLALQAI